MPPARIVAALLALVLLPAAIAATPPAPTPADAGTPVALSAFTVSGSRDVGYTATNTLAGTRLNTALQDIGTALSVVTRELLDDLAATSS